MPSKGKQGVSSPTERAITIKHGSAPEIQAVNIALKKKRSDVSKLSDDLLYETDGGVEQAFYRKRPVSKTMTTTKSTMTNEEDYQVEIAKLIDEENASEATSVRDVNELDNIDETTDDLRIAAVKDAQHQHKALAWKMTPKVHFPVRRDSELESPVPPESLTQFQGSLISTNKVVNWNYLPEPIIDPPFEHRPDKSYLIHQNQPVPLNPLKVWPGYGGNLYFEPFRVESKPIYGRDGSGAQLGARSRSRATSRYAFGDTATTPDALSDSRYMSLPPASPYRSSRKDTPTMSQKYSLQDMRATEPGDLLFQRKMAHLDKDYVLNMKGNPKLHEDWSWIAGMESIGTLCIGDTGTKMKKPPQKPYSRTLIVEKVPRKFVFHPGNNPLSIAAAQSPRPVPLVQVKIDAKKRSRYSSRDFLLRRQRNSASKKSSNQMLKSNSSIHTDVKQREIRRRTRLPSIPIRIKGHKVNETSCYNPWEMFRIGSSKQVRTSAVKKSNPSRQKSLAREIISQSRATNHPPPEDKESLPFSITRWLTPDTSVNKSIKDLVAKPDAFPPQSADHETDDEDKLNYETIRSAYYITRDRRVTADGRRVPNSTPC